MSNKTKIGAKAERHAASYLISRGYEIIANNYRYKRSEIDIIAEIGDIIVFVEVKSRSNRGFGNPEASVNEKKEQKVIEGAENFIYERNWNGRIRFDIIAIDLKTDEITHFEDAFG
ncbi:MAG: YraN family protein [Cyclobacteriaceae bacterium]|nr:YraN family protein [Cyclobacteriaceae bacterium]